MRFLFALICLLWVQPLLANPNGYRTEAPIAYLYDANSGIVMLEKSADKRIPTASMAKLMTGYVTFEAIKAKRVGRDSLFTVRPETWAKWHKRGSTMFLKSGQKVSVEDLLHGVLTLSGNDASVVLAEGLAGSETAFVNEMNEAAQKLGMENSKFATANGWPDGGKSYSSAHDLGLLAKHVIEDHPELFAEFFNRRSFKWNGINQANRNPLLGAVAGADGMKTGHSREAGYCLIGTAKRGERRLIMVIAGLPTIEARIEEARAMMNWGFDSWQEKPLFEADQKVATLPVQLGKLESISAVTPNKISTLGRAGEASQVRLLVRYIGPIKAPLRKGAEIGQLIIQYPDGMARTFPLVAANDVDHAGFLHRALNGFRSLWRMVA